MNFKKIIPFIFYGTVLIQSSAFPMARSKMLLPTTNPFTTKSPASTIVTPEQTMAHATPETVKAATQNLKIENPKPWSEQEVIPLHPELKKEFKEANNGNNAPKSKRKFWESFNAKNLGKSLGLAGLIGYEYEQQEQLAQAQELAEKIAEKSNAELKQDLKALEETIDRFDKDKTTWTDYHNNMVKRFFSIYNYVLSTLPTEELIHEYAKTKNELIAIQTNAFSKHWLKKLSAGKNWFESQESYETRKAKDIADYNSAFFKQGQKTNHLIKDIQNARFKTPDDLRKELSLIKSTVLLEKQNIKNVPNYQPMKLIESSYYPYPSRFPTGYGE